MYPTVTARRARTTQNAGAETATRAAARTATPCARADRSHSASSGVEPQRWSQTICACSGFDRSPWNCTECSARSLMIIRVPEIVPSSIVIAHHVSEPRRDLAVLRAGGRIVGGRALDALGAEHVAHRCVVGVIRLDVRQHRVGAEVAVAGVEVDHEHLVGSPEAVADHPGEHAVRLPGAFVTTPVAVQVDVRFVLSPPVGHPPGVDGVHHQHGRIVGKIGVDAVAHPTTDGITQQRRRREPFVAVHAGEHHQRPTRVPSRDSSGRGADIGGRTEISSPMS